MAAGRRDIPIWAAIVAIVCLTGLAYLNSFAGVFVYDDGPEIAANPALDRLWPPWEAMFRGNRTPARPLPYLTFAIDRGLWGHEPFGYHVTNLAVHLAAALAVFDLARRTLLSPRLPPSWSGRAVPLALVIATIWAVHPLQTQAVTYVYQRIESLCGMCCLVSLAALARGLAGAPSRTWLVVSAVACAVAMACKENAVVLPVLLVIYDWLFYPADTPAAWWSAARGRLWFYAACFLCWLILAAVIITQLGDYPELRGTARSSLTYALTQPGVILHYLRLAVLPVGQCFEYSGWPAVESVSTAQLPAYGVIAALVAVTIYGTVLRRPWAWPGVLFFAALAPTSSVMPVDVLASEHRMYLPLTAVVATVVLGVAAAGDWLDRRMPGSAVGLRRSAAITAVSVAVCLVALTLARNRLYQSQAALWTDVLNHDPGNFRALAQLAKLLDEQGNEQAAFELADRALERAPAYAVYGRLAAGRLAVGDHAAAERRCRRGLERQRAVLAPDDPAVLCTLGDLATALRLQGKITEAAECSTAAIADMRRVLGDAHDVTLTAEQIAAENLARRGDHAAAEAAARDVLARAGQDGGPTGPTAINASITLVRVLDLGGKTGDAARLAKRTLDAVVRKAPAMSDERLLLEDLWAELLEKEGRVDEAVAVRHRLADEQERLHGRQSPMTAAALTKHALAIAARATARGDHARAANIYATIHANYRAALGADHADTIAMAEKQRAAEERARGNAPVPAGR